MVCHGDEKLLSEVKIRKKGKKKKEVENENLRLRGVSDDVMMFTFSSTL